MTRKDRLNDKAAADSARFESLREADPEMPDHVWNVIVRYTPQLPSVQWAAVREFTISNAVSMRPRTFETVRRLMTMSARFNVWVWVSTGVAADAGKVYTQRNVYRYLQECMACRSEIHRWGVVRQLGAVADATAGTQVKQLPSPERSNLAPFTLSDAATMHSWAKSLSTDLKRQNAWAILGLAGGAGLRTAEIADMRVGDVQVVDGRVFVTIPGKHARRVPVMYPWSRTLLRSIDGREHTPDADLFHGFRFDEYRPRSIQTFLTDNPGRVRPTISRLRHTWIVTQIENGLPVPVLMAIAGLTSAAGLNKHLVHAKTLRLEDFFGLIIGEEVAR